MRDSMYDDTSARITLPVAARTTNGVVSGAAVDVAGVGNNFRSSMLLAVSAAITDGTHTVVLEESDTGSGGWTAVAASDLQGALTAFSTANANTVQRQAYLGSKRFLRASVTSATVTTGGTVGAILLLAQGSGAPVT